MSDSIKSAIAAILTASVIFGIYAAAKHPQELSRLVTTIYANWH